MSFSVYVIRNMRQKLYIGHTADVQKRLLRHNGGLPTKSSSYTSKQGGPWTLLHEEKFPTRREAMHREKELKSAKGREFLYNKIILGAPK